jgi:UDP-2,4-diacetamido-2,4,6-trideoxy-beta-L-altropyranose hydrolase
MNFLIRADATPEMGSGHVMRSIALGQLLQDHHHSVFFATKTNNQNLLQRIEKEKFSLIKYDVDISTTDDAEKTAAFAINNKVDFVITDGYLFDTVYQQVIKQHNLKLMCIDDIAGCHYVSDIVLNQNLNAELVFKYSAEPYTKLFLGIDYVILRREFRIIKNYIRVIDNECKKILITLGGGDAKNNTGQLLNKMNDIKISQFDITVLLGSGFMYGEEIKNIAANNYHTITIKKSIDNVVPFMQWCDLAIAAAGTTVWELLTLRTPMLVGIAADNQVPIADQLDKIGAAKNIGWFNELDTDNFINTVKLFLAQNELRYTQVVNQKRINPGNKINDFIKELENIVYEN